jgi:hypothetical protein
VHPCATTLQYQTLSSSQGGIWCYHVSNGFGSWLPTQEGSDVVTCPAASDPASLMRGLRRFYVSSDSGSCLPARKGSDITTCSVAPAQGSSGAATRPVAPAPAS